MSKNIYNKIIDGKGRVLVPQELRNATKIKKGDIVRLGMSGGSVTIRKLDIVEVGDQSPEARNAFVFAAVNYMDNTALLELVEHVAQRIRQEGEGR